MLKLSKDEIKNITPDQIENMLENSSHLFLEAILMRAVLQKIYAIIEEKQGRLSIEDAARIAAMASASSDEDTCKAVAHAQKASGMTATATVQKAVEMNVSRTAH